MVMAEKVIIIKLCGWQHYKGDCSVGTFCLSFTLPVLDNPVNDRRRCHLAATADALEDALFPWYLLRFKFCSLHTLTHMHTHTHTHKHTHVHKDTHMHTDTQWKQLHYIHSTVKPH